MTLTKADLINDLTNSIGLSTREAKDVVNAFFEEIYQTLGSGEEVKLPGFGVFNLRDKQQRPGRNPKTGIEVMISSRRVVTFQPSGVLKDAVDANADHLFQ